MVFQGGDRRSDDGQASLRRRVIVDTEAEFDPMAEESHQGTSAGTPSIKRGLRGVDLIPQRNTRRGAERSELE